MDKAQVAAVRARSYEPGELGAALGKALGLLSETKGLFKPGLKVFIKINNLSSQSPPESAVNTHPAVLREVLRCLLDHGLRPVVGDDVNAGREDPFLIPGHRAVCGELGVRLVNLREDGFREIKIGGRRLPAIFVSRTALEADLIINVPKLKTHSLTGLTGAVKNMYGVIPSGERLRIHKLFPMNEPFCEALVDIFAAAKPRLTVCDAVVAMEGEGPSGGRPRRLGCLLAGGDAVAIDAVASHLVGIHPFAIATNRIAHEQGLGQADLGSIAWLGDPANLFRVRDFKHSLVAFSILRKRLPSSIYAFVQSQLVLTPEVDASACTFCKNCIRVCPQRAIHEEDDRAQVDVSRCIRCLCCHEVCSARAIRLRQTRVGSLMRGVASAWGWISRLLW